MEAAKAEEPEVWADTSGEGPSNDAAAHLSSFLYAYSGGWRNTTGMKLRLVYKHTRPPVLLGSSSSEGGLARIVMLNGPVPTVAEMTWRTVAS